MAILELRLAGFEFPPDLSNDKANFRFKVDVRYLDRRGRPATATAVLPSFDAYWECDPRKRDRPHYVRASRGSRFDMSRIDAWDRVVLLLEAERLHSARVEVYDVDRKDAWDTVQGFLREVVPALLGQGRRQLPSAGPLRLSATSGVAAEDLEAWLIRRLAAQQGDKLLFAGSADLGRFAEGEGPPAEPETVTVTRDGYGVELEVVSL